jgi:hypothetical protein
MPTIPNLFIIGAPKCGTTALAAQLSVHQEIFVDKKEPRYFDAPTFYDFENDYPHKTIESYLALFRSSVSAVSKYSLDASVFSIYSESSIKNILDLSPDAKFIVVLRDPLSASKSMHLQRLKYTTTAMREISNDFDICWNSLSERRVGNGYPQDCRNKFLFRYDLLYSYEKYIHYIDGLINKNNIIYIDYAVYRENPRRIHSAILNWLNIEQIELPLRNLNESFIVEQRIINKIIEKIIKITYSIRKKINLTEHSKKILKNFVNSLLHKKIVKQEVSLYDEEIRYFFKASYQAMDEACSRYDFNKKQ